MKRIIKVLLVSALMMVLMATNVSPAFAAPWWEDNPDKGGKEAAPGQECKGKDKTGVKGDQDCGWR